MFTAHNTPSLLGWAVLGRPARQLLFFLDFNLSAHHVILKRREKNTLRTSVLLAKQSSKHMAAPLDVSHLEASARLQMKLPSPFPASHSQATANPPCPRTMQIKL